MKRTVYWLFPLALGIAGFSANQFLAADEPAVEIVRERKSFLPIRNHQPLKGTVIGLLVDDAGPVLGLEGRSGPADQLCFSVNGGSYRWVYVPTLDNAQITNLQVPVGDKGQVQLYPALNMATPRSVTPWGVTKHFSLVEIQVNNNQGSPAGDSFVATDIKVLDGSKRFPVKTQDVVEVVKKRYAEHIKKNDQQIENALANAGKKALGDKKATGPREKSDLMYLTWLPETERIRVQFLTKISDGAYQVIKGGFGPRDKLPLPPIPKAGGPNFRPARPGPINIKTGITFGIEFGMAFEVDKRGEIVRIQQLPIEAFQQVLNAPGEGPAPRPLPLPVEKR